MDNQTVRRCLRAVVVVASLVACLPPGGCSPAAPAPVATGTGPPESSNSERPVDRARSAPSDGSPDVIVVGAGISGLSAALDLARGGAKVTVIDMSSVFGGHAVMSQGSVSIEATPAQERAGIHDSPELAFQDFHRWGEDPATEWVRSYVDNSRHDIYDWLDELGVRFSEVVASSGNSVPREHQPVGRGIGLVTPIYRACLEMGNVDFVWNSKVEQLLTDNGRV